RVDMALGDASAAGRVYATLRAHLAEELRVEPSAETVALADQIRTSAAASRGSRLARRAAVESRPPSELTAPLVGRAAAFRQLVGSFQQARGGQRRPCCWWGRPVSAKRGWPASLSPGPGYRELRCSAGKPSKWEDDCPISRWWKPSGLALRRKMHQRICS